MKSLTIGSKTVSTAIVQGGMGVGVSRSGLAGAVAKCGGIGIISTAQIGYDEKNFEKDQPGCNIKAIKKHIAKAKEIANGNGLVGVNVMVALKHYHEHVQAAVQAGADLVVCGAGLPLDLPELVKSAENDAPNDISKDTSRDTSKDALNKSEHHTYMAPIVSSGRAAELILKRWDTKYSTTADMLVVEGPKAGGHLGYKPDELKDIENIDFDRIVKDVIEAKKPYEEKYGHSIPVVAGGGICDSNGVKHIMALGADGVQVASRFVATKECDAADAYKDAYVNAKEEDIVIVKSPVGMPGRALNNAFIKRVRLQKEPVKKCYLCLEKCNPAEVPYCITKALTDAVRGDIDNGLIFCGANAYKINKISTVEEVMKELSEGFR